MTRSNDWSETIQRYSDELRRLYQQNDSAVPAPPSSPPAPQKVEESSLAPAPEIEEEGNTAKTALPETAEAAEAEKTEPAAETPADKQPFSPPAPPFGADADGTALKSNDSPATNAAETDVGTLTVRLISARGTIPIVGATVTVFRQERDGKRLIYMGETDESGESPEWSLPTVDRSLSLEPSAKPPYVTYAVQGNAVGYATFLNEGVAVFGGVKTVQRIPMLPLPDVADNAEETLMVTRAADPPSELN